MEELCPLVVTRDFCRITNSVLIHVSSPEPCREKSLRSGHDILLMMFSLTYGQREREVRCGTCKLIPRKFPHCCEPVTRNLGLSRRCKPLHEVSFNIRAEGKGHEMQDLSVHVGGCEEF